MFSTDSLFRQLSNEEKVQWHKIHEPDYLSVTERKHLAKAHAEFSEENNLNASEQLLLVYNVRQKVLVDARGENAINPLVSTW